MVVFSLTAFGDLNLTHNADPAACSSSFSSPSFSSSPSYPFASVAAAQRGRGVRGLSRNRAASMLWRRNLHPGVMHVSRKSCQPLVPRARRLSTLPRESSSGVWRLGAKVPERNCLFCWPAAIITFADAGVILPKCTRLQFVSGR